MKVLVTRNQDFKHLIGTWQEVEREDLKVGDEWRDVFRITSIDHPVWLERHEFQKEDEVKAKDFIINHYKETGTFPKMITYGEKQLKYLLSNRILRERDGLIQVEYHWANHIMSFAVVNSTEIDNDGRLYLKLHSVRYLGISSYEYPEPKEYYVE